MSKVKIDSRMVEYKIVRSGRKTISLGITEDGGLEIKAPYRCSSDFIKAFIDEKKNWIKDRLEYLDKVQKSRSERSFSSGETLKYLGKDYPLEVGPGPAGKIAAGFDGEKFFVTLPDSMGQAEKRERLIEIIEGLYRKLARKVFEERTRHFGNIIGVHPVRIAIKEQKTLWGSCSSKNNVNYNWRLIMAPQEVLDYVVVHELCHMLHRDHSSGYWKEVSRYMPDYMQRMDWLKVHGGKLQFQYVYNT